MHYIFTSGPSDVIHMCGRFRAEDERLVPACLGNELSAIFSSRIDILKRDGRKNATFTRDSAGRRGAGRILLEGEKFARRNVGRSVLVGCGSEDEDGKVDGKMPGIDRHCYN
ncbi:hypothetical protein Zmor_016482 [Zophobas morio]|uniref:Uncharacterized protein n=1 Tax=Zophobas morio TaxID=2755281 RepID=A0AA38MBL8_9CUCU|nr:hypothetical protein Zmor_016482 [Zophobas morio]